MNAERKHPDVIPTPEAERQAAEERALDEALADAAHEIASSLQREEAELQQRQLVWTWIPIVVVGFIAVIVGFSLPRALRDETPQTAERSSAASQPGDRYTLRLPRGFEWQVELIDLGNNLYQLKSDHNLNGLGIYNLEGNRLKMKRPVDPRLTEFVWERINRDKFLLVEQPPLGKTGSNYLGATLERNRE